MNIYEGVSALIRSAEQTAQRMDDLLHSIRGAVPESPTNPPLSSSGLLGSMERLAGLMVSIDQKTCELNDRIGSEKKVAMQQAERQMGGQIAAYR